VEPFSCLVKAINNSSTLSGGSCLLITQSFNIKNSCAQVKCDCAVAFALALYHTNTSSRVLLTVLPPHN
jgi:hypothetical protein